MSAPAPGVDAPPPMQPDAAGAPAVGYARPGTAQSTPPFDLHAFFTHVTCWTIALAIFLVLTVFVVPKYRAVFMDFRLDVSAATKLLFTLCSWPVAALPLVLLIAGGAGDSVTAGFLSRGATPGARRAYRLAVIFVVGGITLFVALAIFLPYVALVQGVSGKK